MCMTHTTNTHRDARAPDVNQTKIHGILKQLHGYVWKWRNLIITFAELFVIAGFFGQARFMCFWNCFFPCVCVCLFCFFLLVSANKFVGLSMFFAFRFIKIHRIIINFESTNNRTHTNSYLWAFSVYTLKKNVATVRKAYIHIKSLDLNLDRPNEQTKKKNTKETETQRLTTIRENCT